MKEYSIEEALKKLSTGKKIKMYELLRTFKKEGIENFVITRKKYVDVILSDYKRVLKENEEWQKAYQEEKDKQFELIQNTNNTIKTANIAIKDLQEKLKEVIPVQKVKDKIEEYKNMLKTCNKAKDIDRIKAINERILELQELLEGRK